MTAPKLRLNRHHICASLAGFVLLQLRSHLAHLSVLTTSRAAAAACGMGSQEGQALAAGHSLPGLTQRMVLARLETIRSALACLTPHKEAHISSSPSAICFVILKLIILK